MATTKVGLTHPDGTDEWYSCRPCAQEFHQWAKEQVAIDDGKWLIAAYPTHWTSVQTGTAGDG